MFELTPELGLFVNNYVICFVCMALTLALYSKLWGPIRVYKDLTKLTRRVDRDYGNVPPLYPNGWLAVLESHELSNNQIKAIFAFGKDLVVYRGAKGKIHAFDAYCPHLGANLGVGGTVLGDSLKCPFHGWVFDETGKCTLIPGVDCSNSLKAELKKYKTMEINGFIYVWHHINGNNPDWFPQEYQNIQQMVYRGTMATTVNGPIQDPYENLADYQHVHFVHNPLTFPQNLIFNFIATVGWSAGSGSLKHTSTSYFRSIITIKRFGWKMGDNDAQVTIIGPGIAHFYTKFTLIRKMEFVGIQSIIQHAPFRYSLTTRLYTRPGLFYKIMSYTVLKEMSKQVEADAIIWTNKVYLDKPLLMKNEGSIGEFRRWFKQFY